MAQFDAHPVLAYSTVQSAPVPPLSGTALSVQIGDGAYFSSPPFNVVVWPSGADPTFGNAEIVRCTGRSGDTLSISRGQEGTTQRSIAVGWQVSAAITPKSLNDIQTQMLPLTGGTLQPVADSPAVFATRRSTGAGGSTLFQIDTDTPLITSAAPFLITGPQQQVYAGTVQGDGFLAEVWDGPGTNLVPNPTFESGNTNWIAGSGYSASQSTAAAKSGAASLELSKPTTGGTISGITDQVKSFHGVAARELGAGVYSWR